MGLEPVIYLSKDATVPICPITVEWTNSNHKQVSRQQLPLKLAWSITIHKSQGQTLKTAVIDIGKKEFVSGITFVAFSRMKQLKDCVIVGYEYDRYKRIKDGKRIKDKKQEEIRLQILDKETK